MIATQWEAQVDRLLADRDVMGLPEVTAMTGIESDEAPVRRGRPALRQSLAATSMRVARSESWWEKAGREHFTQRATQECERMRTSVEYRQVPHQILGKYLGLVRPE